MVPGVYRFETREITDKTYTMTINNYMINFSCSMGGLDYKSAKGYDSSTCGDKRVLGKSESICCH